jgi:hypothetical protein
MGTDPFRSKHRDDMSRKELVLVVSRAFALLLITWALVEVTYLPDRVFALCHHLSQRSVLATRDYLSSYYLIMTAFTIVRMLALFLASLLFWRCGPRVEALFSPQQGNQEASGQGRAG